MRRGFTLLELIVVTLIIAVMVALLLPAISRTRNAAVLISCQNNLKQLGLAAHGYRDAHGHFPPGTIPSDLQPGEQLSWQVALLPHLELVKLYERFDPAVAFDAPANAEAEKLCVLPVFRCPGFYTTTQPPLAFLHTNYVGVAGIGSGAAALPLDGPGVGFFGYNRKLTTEDVKDGTANTLMVLETAHNVGPLVRGGPATVRGLDLAEDPLLGEGRPFGGLHREDKTFGGTRPLGSRILFADGSVHLTPLSVDAAVLGALATVAGDDRVPPDW